MKINMIEIQFTENEEDGFEWIVVGEGKKYCGFWQHGAFFPDKDIKKILSLLEKNTEKIYYR